MTELETEEKQNVSDTKSDTPTAEARGFFSRKIGSKFLLVTGIIEFLIGVLTLIFFKFQTSFERFGPIYLAIFGVICILESEHSKKWLKLNTKAAKVIASIATIVLILIALLYVYFKIS